MNVSRRLSLPETTTTATDCRKPGRWLAFLPLIFAVLQSGCMVSPHDEQVISDPDEEITFSGYAGVPGQAVIIEYRWGSQWIEIARLTSATVPVQMISTTGASHQFYPWLTTLAIPAPAWTGDSRGRYAAEVRARIGTSSTLYFGEDFGECAAPFVGAVNTIVTDCSARGARSIFLYLPSVGGEEISADMDLRLEIQGTTGSSRNVGIFARITNRGRARTLRLPRYRYTTSYSGESAELTAPRFYYTTAPTYLLHPGGSTEAPLPLVGVHWDYPDRVTVEVIGTNQRGKLFIKAFSCTRQTRPSERPPSYECR